MIVTNTKRVGNTCRLKTVDLSDNGKRVVVVIQDNADRSREIELRLTAKESSDLIEKLRANTSAPRR